MTCQILHEQIVACLSNVISAILSLCFPLSSHPDLVSFTHAVPLCVLSAWTVLKSHIADPLVF